MTTTLDSAVPDTQMLRREYISHHGEVFATATLAPSVLPMQGFSLEHIEQTIWLKAVRNKGVIRKGDIYRLAHIHSNGQVIVALPNSHPLVEKRQWINVHKRDHHAGSDVDQIAIAGLWPMDLFAEYVINKVEIHDTAPNADRQTNGARDDGKEGGAAPVSKSEDGGTTPRRGAK